MLLPMGLPEDVSVIAWGLSLERYVLTNLNIMAYVCASCLYYYTCTPRHYITLQLNCAIHKYWICENLKPGRLHGPPGLLLFYSLVLATQVISLLFCFQANNDQIWDIKHPWAGWTQGQPPDGPRQPSLPSGPGLSTLIWLYHFWFSAVLSYHHVLFIFPNLRA